jgi:hypothetical protein
VRLRSGFASHCGARKVTVGRIPAARLPACGASGEPGVVWTCGAPSALRACVRRKGLATKRQIPVLLGQNRSGGLSRARVSAAHPRRSSGTPHERQFRRSLCPAIEKPSPACFSLPRPDSAPKLAGRIAWAPRCLSPTLQHAGCLSKAHMTRLWCRELCSDGFPSGAEPSCQAETRKSEYHQHPC